MENTIVHKQSKTKNQLCDQGRPSTPLSEVVLSGIPALVTNILEGEAMEKNRKVSRQDLNRVLSRINDEPFPSGKRKREFVKLELTKTEAEEILTALDFSDKSSEFAYNTSLIEEIKKQTKDTKE